LEQRTVELADADVGVKTEPVSEVVRRVDAVAQIRGSAGAVRGASRGALAFVDAEIILRELRVEHAHADERRHLPAAAPIRPAISRVELMSAVLVEKIGEPLERELVTAPLPA